MTRLISILLIFFLLCSTASFTQNFYSTFYTAPLLLNPANTGNAIGDYRLGGVYRNETNAFSQNSSGSFFADSRILASVIPDNDVFGIGCAAAYEKNAFFGLKNNHFLFSLAYTKNLDAKLFQKLGVGFQVNFSNKRIQQPSLVFPDQIIKWSQIGFNGITPTPGKVININYIDLNAGLNFQTLLSGKSLLSVGVSVLHTNKPYKIFNGGEFSLSPESCLQIGFENKTTKRNKFYASFTINDRLSAKGIDDMCIGAIYQVGINKTRYKISAGSFFRRNSFSGNSLAPAIGLFYNNFNLNLLYNINLSSSTIAPRGGGEIGMVFMKKRPVKKKF